MANLGTPIFIAGNNKTGPIVLNANGTQLYYRESYATQGWSLVAQRPWGGFAPAGMTGKTQSGVAIYGGARVAVMTSFTDGTWTELNPAPFNILANDGMAGDNATGLLICQKIKSNLAAYMSSYKENAWHWLAPWDYAIDGIAGSCASGPVVYSGRKVAYMKSLTESAWTALPDCPIGIEALVGNNDVGLVAYGNGSLYQLPSYSSGWQQINNPGFLISAMAGQPDTGIVCLISGHSNEVLYTTNFRGNWTIANPTT